MDWTIHIGILIWAMNKKMNLRKVAEPFMYVIIVALAGLITTLFSHGPEDKQVNGSGYVTFGSGAELELIVNQNQNEVDLWFNLEFAELSADMSTGQV